MKKLTIVLSILLLCCASASAQWYEVAGLHRTGKKITSSVQGDAVLVTEGEGGLSADAQVSDYGFRNEENDTEKDGQRADLPFNYDMPDILNVGIILPFQSTTKVNANFVEMYSGALIAVKDLGAGNSRINFTVLDESESDAPVTEDFLDDNQLVIGPVNLQDIQDCLDICPSDRFIVSPLEPKSASLTEENRIIQAPVHWTRQADELVDWLASETGWNDEIVLLRDSVDTDTDQAAYLISKLVSTGRKFRTIKRVQEYEPTAEGTTRYIIASNRDSYINTMSRALAILSGKFNNIVLYGTSKVRNSSGIDPEHLYNLNLHYTTNYFIDYEDPAVKRFIYTYRALFKTEPGQFAFQGYDLTHYFLNMLSRYGVEWYKKLPDYSERGLQSDFRFDYTNTVGNNNVAVRRVVLGKNLSAILQ